MTIASELVLTLDSTLSKASDREVPTALLTFFQQYIWTNGDGDNQANALFSDIRTLAGSSGETIDLRATLVDSVCDPLTLTAVKALIVRSFPENTGFMVVGPHSVDGFTAIVNDVSDLIVIRPGGILVMTAPNSVGYFVDATRRNLRITNLSTATSIYDFIVIGVDE